MGTKQATASTEDAQGEQAATAVEDTHQGDSLPRLGICTLSAIFNICRHALSFSKVLIFGLGEAGYSQCTI